MDEMTIAINTIVESYFNELITLSKRATMPITAATFDLNQHRKEIQKKNNIKKLERETDFLLNEFTDIHTTHTSEFWEYVTKLVTPEGREKIVEAKLKQAFNLFQKEANRAISRLKNNAESVLDDFYYYEISYREAEVKKLYQLTFDIIYASWMERINPITGEKI